MRKTGKTITRGGRIKRTYNLAFDEIESESSAKRARSTIPCQAEGSGEDVRTMIELVDAAAETAMEQHQDQFLRTVERLIRPSARKRHLIGGEMKKELGWRKYVVDERRNGQEPLGVAEKPFPAVVCLDTT